MNRVLLALCFAVGRETGKFAISRIRASCARILGHFGTRMASPSVIDVVAIESDLYKGLIEGEPIVYKLVLKSQDEKWYE